MNEYNDLFVPTLDEMVQPFTEPAPKPIRLKKVSDLDDSPIEWLVPNWIPKTGITMLSSDGGIGKTCLWCSIVSSLSRGQDTILRHDPDLNEKKTVLCFSGEDTENVLRNRLEQSEADNDHVFVVGLDTELFEDPNKELTFDSPELEQLLDAYKPSLVVFDPIQAFIGKGVDMSRRNQVRSAIRPLLVLSAKYNAAMLIVSHTNKRSGESGRNKMADSSDIWDVARSCIMCGFTGNGMERYASLEKSSYGRLNVRSVLFDITDGKVCFLGTTEEKMKDFVASEQRKKYENKTPTLKNKCCTDILRLLESNNRFMEQKEMDSILEDECEYKQGTIKNAKNELVTTGFIKMIKRSDGSVGYARTDKR